MTDTIGAQWGEPGRRTRSESIAQLVERLKADPSKLAPAVEAASRYLELGLADQARDVLATAVARRSPKQAARSGDRAEAYIAGLFSDFEFLGRRPRRAGSLCDTLLLSATLGRLR